MLTLAECAISTGKNLRHS